MERPEPHEAPQGCVYVAVPDRQWRLDEGRPCRYGAGPNRQSCRAPSVAAMDRGRNRYDPPFGRTESWWAYCPDHLFGRWIEDGQVMHWVLRPVGEVEAHG